MGGSQGVVVVRRGLYIISYLYMQMYVDPLHDECAGHVDYSHSDLCYVYMYMFVVSTMITFLPCICEGRKILE